MVIRSGWRGAAPSVLLVVLLLTPAAAFDDARNPACPNPADAPPEISSAREAIAPSADLATELSGHPATAVRLFGTVGLGFLDTKREVGADIPLGLALLLERWRLLGTASILDIAMVEGSKRDPRYYRPHLGRSYCVDSVTGQYVPEHYCSGGTDFTVSSGVDLSYIVFNEVWFSDKPGKVTVGLGYRLRNPDNPYATVGVFFPSKSRTAMGVRLDVGSDFVHMGVIWGLDLVRFFER